MKSRLPVTLAVTLSAVALALTGCSSSPAATPAPSEPTATSAAPAETTPAEVDAEVELPYSLRDPASDIDTSRIPEGYVAFEEVDAEAGPYLRVTLAPDNPVLHSTDVFDQASLEEVGLTEADGLAAQQAALAFSVQELISSNVLDVPNPDLNAWFEENIQPYVSAELEDDILNAEDPNVPLTAISGSGYYPQPLIHVKGTPLIDPNVQVNFVQGYISEDVSEPRIGVEVASTNTFTASRDATVAAYERNLGEPATPLLEQIGDVDIVNLISAGTHTYAYDPVSKQFTYLGVDYTVYEATSGISITDKE